MSTGTANISVDINVNVDGNTITVWLCNQAQLFRIPDEPGQTQYVGSFDYVDDLTKAREELNKDLTNQSLPSWKGAFALSRLNHAGAEIERLTETIQRLEDELLARELDPVENDLRLELAKLRVSVARIAQSVGVNGSGQLPFTIHVCAGYDELHHLALTQQRGWNALCGMILDQVDLIQDQQ